MSTLLEKHIVELLQERNEKAISLLYEHYGDTLYGVANKVVRNIKPELLDVRENLEKIEDKYQMVLEALFFQGMTQQEASDELDIPLGTIKSRLKIGLRELKKIYGTSVMWIPLLLIIQI